MMYLIIYDRFLYLLHGEVFLYGEALCKVDGRILRLLLCDPELPGVVVGRAMAAQTRVPPLIPAGLPDSRHLCPRLGARPVPSPSLLGCPVATLTVIPLPGRTARTA